MLTMTEEQRKMARAALGLNGRNASTHRNRYVCCIRTDSYSAWEAMVSNGWAIKRPGQHGGRYLYAGGEDCFQLTLAGALLALNPGETLDDEDFPGAAQAKV